MADENNHNSIQVPAPTAWPMLTALGIALIFAGLVTHVAVSLVGAALMLRAAAGWWYDVLPEQKEEGIPISVEDRNGHEVPVSTAVVERLGNRIRIPVEVHPYWTGLYGGVAGAVAMAVVAMLFGLIAERSIWYPINLLAAGILPSLAEAPVEQLKQFSAAGLLAGAVLHATISLLVGLLYAIMLPMFPRGASWRSGLVTPLMWSGLVAATLDVINPTLNQRINWVWFVGSQIAFGIAAGFVIARTAKIATMQSWPLAQRAGIEGLHHEEEQT